MSGTWLLSAQTLLDLISRERTAAQNWADGDVLESEMRVSEISMALARARINSLSDAVTRTYSSATLAGLQSALFRSSGEVPIEFGKRHAAVWEALIHDRSLDPLSQIDRMVYATAVAEGLVMVDRLRPSTEALRRLNVPVVALV